MSKRVYLLNQPPSSIRMVPEEVEDLKDSLFWEEFLVQQVELADRLGYLLEGNLSSGVFDIIWKTVEVYN